VVESSHSWPN